MQGTQTHFSMSVFHSLVLEQIYLFSRDQKDDVQERINVDEASVV